MSTKIRNKTSEKKTARFKRKSRIKDKVKGTSERPRLVVFKSNQHIYAQVIDDVKGVTLANAKSNANIKGAKEVGSTIASLIKKNKITKVVFDRNGFIYHGKVKALAEAAREAGLGF